MHAEHEIDDPQWFLDERRCVECAVWLRPRDAKMPLCPKCDSKFERELTLWLEFALACRSGQ